MNSPTLLYRVIVTNALTLYYALTALVLIAISSIKSAFSGNQVKPCLVPPACLIDPKYGAHKYAKVNNIKLHYVESGDSTKPLVLFLHGFPEFWYSWRHQILEFQKDYWCIALDMRGYGDSERPDGVHAYVGHYLINDIRELLRYLGREKMIMIAHDWGGIVGCEYRDYFPETLNAIIIMGSMSKTAFGKELWSNPEQMRKSWYVFMYRMPAIPERLLQLDNLKAFDRFMYIEGKDGVTKEDLECYKFWYAKKHTLTPPINYYRANFEYAFPEKQMSEVKIPMLAILGENDLYLEKNVLKRLEEEYPCIETMLLKDCSHFLQQEEPKKVNEIIRNFLEKHSL